MASRHASLLGTLALALVARTAFADEPAPAAPPPIAPAQHAPPPYAVPYGAPPPYAVPYGAPPPYAVPYGAPPPYVVPYGVPVAPVYVERPKERRSVGMLVGGIVVAAAGGITMVSGLFMMMVTGMYDSGSAFTPRNAALVLGGGAVLAGGLVLVVLGNQRVPVGPRRPVAAAAPQVVFTGNGVALQGAF